MIQDFGHFAISRENAEALFWMLLIPIICLVVILITGLRLILRKLTSKQDDENMYANVSPNHIAAR